MRHSNKPRFSRESCRKGGSRTRGYETVEDQRQRALIGRTDQIEILLGERIVRTCGETKLTGRWADFRGK